MLCLKMHLPLHSAMPLGEFTLELHLHVYEMVYM